MLRKASTANNGRELLGAVANHNNVNGADPNWQECIYGCTECGLGIVADFPYGKGDPLAEEVRVELEYIERCEEPDVVQLKEEFEARFGSYPS